MAGDTYIPNQSLPGMGPHDIGGVDPFEPIDTSDHGMNYWEMHANALRMAISRYSNLGTLDEMRRLAEDLGERFYQIGYFERQTEALALVLVERGIISQHDLDTCIDDIDRKFKDTPTISLPDLPENHDHDHDHFKEDERGEGPNHHHKTNLAIQHLLQEKGLLKAEEVRYMVEKFEGDFPNRGAEVVARAWVDSDFKSRMLENAAAAIAEIGIDLEYQSKIIALENTADTHNVIVCTLCSCYPRFLMGQPPTWYKSRSYRSRVVFEPRAVLKEFGTEIPENVSIRVHDSNADMRYIVIPRRPEGTNDWTKEQLESIISRDHLVGVSVPRLP